MPTTNHHQIAIVGAGPIGIELAVALKQAGVQSLLHLEAGQIGSTMQWWAPGTHFFSSPERIEIAGIPIPSINQDKVTREKYLAYLRAVVQQHQLNIKTHTRVNKISKNDDHLFELQTSKSTHGVGGPDEHSTSSTSPQSQSTTFTANNIILAIGNMHHPRLLEIPGENQPFVSHYLAEIHQYFNQNVLIVGGKNSAVEAAIRLYRAGAKVTISYRGNEFDPKRVKYWLKPEIEWLIKKGRIGFYPNTVVQQITGHEVILQTLDQSQRTTQNNTRSVPADSVLLLTGYTQNPSLFQQLGIKLRGEERKPTFNHKTMETNIPGVFTAGTAAGGSQQGARLFIENSHVHVSRIVRAITGKEITWQVDPDFTDHEES